MKNATLCFLVKRNDSGLIENICLAMKKRGFGEGKWNGVGGKVNENETVESALVRETKEEIDVAIQEYKKVGILDFVFVDQVDWDMKVHIYVSEQWDGDPQESEEMRPLWYSVDSIPYQNMWADDEFWFPMMLEDKLFIGEFRFTGQGDLSEHLLNEVSSEGF